eukprot:gene16591-biopygen5051
MPKMKNMLKAQKALGHRRRRWGTFRTERRILECAGYVVDCKAVEDEDSLGHGRPRKPVEGVADAEDPETVEGVESVDGPERQWQATGSRGVC